VGAVLGGVVLVAALVALSLYCYSRRTYSSLFGWGREDSSDSIYKRGDHDTPYSLVL
jgi:hypothetical protein